MRPNPYVVHALKCATLTLVGIVVVIGAVAILQNMQTGSLTGRLVSQQEQGIIPTMNFDQRRVQAGFVAPKDSHIVFTLPYNTRITRITFFGGPKTDKEQYWGYCFTGNEAANKERGLTGKAMYDGQFFFSIGERLEQAKRPALPSDNDLSGILREAKRPPKEQEMPKSTKEIFTGGQTCYVMSKVDLPAGLDADGDGLNDTSERELGLNPNNPDVDRDGIGDGDEYFFTMTNPKDPDTDHDSLGDRCEDKNADGKLSVATETSPLEPDTDGDGLCDGNAYYGTLCPEPRKTVCYQTPAGDRDCRSEPTTPINSEDVNMNCIVDQKDAKNKETDPKKAETFGINDWIFKWNLLKAKGGTDNAVGTPAPEFPIPALPQASQQLPQE